MAKCPKNAPNPNLTSLEPWAKGVVFLLPCRTRTKAAQTLYLYARPAWPARSSTRTTRYACASEQTSTRPNVEKLPTRTHRASATSCRSRPCRILLRQQQTTKRNQGREQHHTTTQRMTQQELSSQRPFSPQEGRLSTQPLHPWTGPLLLQLWRDGLTNDRER